MRKLLRNLRTSMINSIPEANYELLNHIKTRKLRYFGHVMRNTVEGSVMTGLVEGTRMRGRTSISWLDSIARPMWCGLSGSDLLRTVQNRKRWMSLTRSHKSDDDVWLEVKCFDFFTNLYFRLLLRLFNFSLYAYFLVNLFRVNFNPRKFTPKIKYDYLSKSHLVCDLVPSWRSHGRIEVVWNCRLSLVIFLLVLWNSMYNSADVACLFWACDSQWPALWFFTLNRAYALWLGPLYEFISCYEILF